MLYLLLNGERKPHLSFEGAEDCEKGKNKLEIYNAFFVQVCNSGRL